MAEIPWSVGQLMAGLWMPRAGEGNAEERRKHEGSSWLPRDPRVPLPLADHPQPKSALPPLRPQKPSPSPQGQAPGSRANPVPTPGTRGRAANRGAGVLGGEQEASEAPERPQIWRGSGGHCQGSQPTRQQGISGSNSQVGLGCLLQAQSDPATQRASSGACASALGGDSRR